MVVPVANGATLWLPIPIVTMADESVATSVPDEPRVEFRVGVVYWLNSFPLMMIWSIVASAQPVFFTFRVIK